MAARGSSFDGARPKNVRASVPGVSLSLVTIDKIPFPVPDEPLHAARRSRAQARGVDAFVAVDLPAAALVLAQGAGRLIRTRDDRGVVAVLDPRLAKQSYRAQLLAAMPPLRRSIDLAETCAFLEEVSGTSPSAANPLVEPADVAPSALRRDLEVEASFMLRHLVACTVCDAAVGVRCQDETGTSAYVHEARVRAATASTD